MSHTQTTELNKIPLGSGTFYVVEWTGTIPTDAEIEIEANIIGRTKNGATVTYSSNFYTAKSDDGKASKTKLVDDSATISYGMITWNANTLNKLISTASVSESNGKRTALIGGAANDDGKSYLIRFVSTDTKDGDIRITAVGKNTGGWTAAFAPNSETTVQPTFECEPLDSDGRLLKYEEEILGLQSLSLTLVAGSTAGKTKVSTVSPTTEANNSLKYKIAASAVSVSYDDVCSSGWSALTVGTTEITATAGQIITVVEVDSSNKAKKYGNVTVVDNIG